MTREEWLTKAAQLIYTKIIEPVAVLPGNRKYAVSCGWPSKRATSRSNRRAGECWDAKACQDGNTYHIFITPLLSEAVQGDGGGVLPTLAHELIHAVKFDAVHKGEFRQVALAIGLEGKMTATVAGSELCEKLAAIARQLGPYPHGSLLLRAKKPGKSTCRFVKVEAVKCCGYIVRTTRKWLDEVGPPKCPHGSRMVEVQ
jgi:hypothetical protein